MAIRTLKFNQSNSSNNNNNNTLLATGSDDNTAIVQSLSSEFTVVSR